ncbi:MAG: peptidoglycan-binding protein [Oscillatoria sp. PMC 1051.18]|uniref:peptidoglycan-binding domain-containing protein n=1 Tax=Oscillatoria salina TaxID=331517 RepID=UPI0013B832A7|nr:peptidoglycan-binding protein [Oscillatoria salina]MBZ8179008.1 peptidoglycan-binding protein [Oscillatoria salina IIICB1]MEC4896227.1 peptidoglycan-binding protein [Oscillatoria sp. PMC 1050.18]MEC5033122.1 peptidoglycan-binding protein [Oscillatoria sp. PMC 1051.18]NET88461.1 peptidoglycan-binding protein [Kamptonema sp. SIO1D9]
MNRKEKPFPQVKIWQSLLSLGLVATLPLFPLQPIFAQPNTSTQINRPTLRVGSRGTEVSQIQAALKLLGYFEDTVDGTYAESTVIAVSKFQQAAGLNVDGIVGQTTWNRLFPMTPPQTTATASPSPSASNNENTAPAATIVTTNNEDENQATVATSSSAAVTLPILREGMRGPAVTQLQQRLRTLGFLEGLADGDFGTETLAAVKAAQEKFGLEIDGVVGPATWRALLNQR